MEIHEVILTNVITSDKKLNKWASFIMSTKHFIIWLN